MIQHDRCENQELSRLEKSRLKAESVDLAGRFKEAGDKKKSERCEKCGTFLEFELYEHISTEEQKRKLESANFCKVKWCPMCAMIKQRKLANETRSILKQVEALRPVKYVFLTLTIKNPSLTELNSTLKTMNKAFKLLTKSEEFSSVVLGYIRALEALGGSTQAGEAHPHYHCLLVVKPSYFKDKYISQARWSELWRRSLKVDYTPIVDVRRIRQKSAEWSEVDSAIFETLKYLAKPQDIKRLSQADFEELDRQMRNAKQYTRGGVLKDIKPEKDDGFSPEEWELIGREFYQWVNGKYKET
jgi:plasmid rolling circle replication initiator protein Rep